MSPTPTAALVEEAEKMAVRALDGTASREEKSVLFASLASSLRCAEAERDELRATVTRLNRRAQTAEAGVRDNVEVCKAAGVSMGRTLANAAADMYLRRAEQAEAERDAQHALVLRLTAERDEARARIDRILDPPIKRMNMADGEINVVFDAPEMARIIATTFWDCLDEHKAKNYVEMSFASPESPTKRVVVTVRKLIGRTPEELREAVAKERDLLTEENARLQKERDEAQAELEYVKQTWAEMSLLEEKEIKALQARVATLELLRRGGK